MTLPAATVDHAALSRWLGSVVAAHGADASTWAPRARLLAAALSADVLEARGVHGLTEPTTGHLARLSGTAAPVTEPARSAPYPDTGHLLGRPVPDGNRTSTAHTPTDDADVAGALVRSGVRWSPEQRRPWSEREAEWLAENALRSLVEVSTADTIRDRDGAPLTCRHEGWVYQHVEQPDAFTFRAATCKVRARCPHCGRTYGEDQGAELRSLMDAALARRSAPLGPTDSMAWGVVVTLPRAVTAFLGELADDPRRSADLRAELRKLVGIARSYLVHLFDLDDRRELGAALNLHWWSSNNPTNGYHWHVHALVPNVRKDGAALRRRGMFTPDKLARSRAHLTAELCAAWPGLVDGGRPANANVRWYPASKKGRRRLSHRCRYDARHPWADALKLSRRAPGLLFSEAALPAVRLLADRVQDLQRVKLRRYVGWLVPGRRRPVGLVPAEREPDQWAAVADGHRRIVGFTDSGVRVVKAGLYDPDRVHEVPGELVAFDSQAPPRRWEYRPPADVSA